MSFEFDDETMRTKPNVDIGTPSRNAFDFRPHIPSPKISGQPLSKIGLEMGFCGTWIPQVSAARTQLFETCVLPILAEKDNLEHEIIESRPSSTPP